MKKTLITLVMLLFISSSFVFADSDDVVCETIAGTIEYDISTNTVSLTDYNHAGSSPSIEGWTIYKDGDLIIDLSGSNMIDGSVGIYVTGNLTLKGTGNLSIGNLVVDGDSITIECPEVYFQNGTSSYTGPKVHYPSSVKACDSSSQEQFAKYYVDGKYRDYEGNDLAYLNFYSTCGLADLTNIYKGSPLYRYNTTSLSWDIETINENGFVIYESGVGTTVDYDETGAAHSLDRPVYDVTFYDDLSSSTPKVKYIELAFNESEWGKIVGYQVLNSSNAYEYKLVDGTPTFIPFVENNIYYEQDGFVADRSIYDDGSGNKIGSAFYAFGITKNNILSVKVLGESSYVYININVYDTHNYPDYDPYYVIPNTGIK